MIEDRFEAISADRRDIARAALRAAFGRVPIDAITMMTGGASTAATYKVETGGRHYVLRLEGEPSPLRNPHQYVSMLMASEAGIAPAIHHVDEDARVAVIDYIAHVPLKDYPGGPPALAKALGELLARLQTVPCFSYFVIYPDIVARLFAHVRRTGLFAESVLEPHVARLEQLRHAYNANPPVLVSSHNDSIPSNILFDGRRLWMIDWESSYCNDRLADVAIMLDNLARTPELEDILLHAWLDRAPDAAVLSRLAIVRPLTRLYYAGVLLSASAAAGWTSGDRNLAVPTLAEFQEAIHAGRLKAGSPETKHTLGKMFLESFLSGGLPPGFDAAI